MGMLMKNDTIDTLQNPFSDAQINPATSTYNHPMIVLSSNGEVAINRMIGY